MKKLTFILAICISLCSFAQAQIPPKAFNYSAVARNAAGQPIATSTIGIQITILKTSTTGTSVYSENHFLNTDAYGLFNLVIGGGSLQSGNMSTIDWSADNYYLKVGMDANGGTNFLTMGTTQLLSVPYALHAATADSIVGGITNETDPIFGSSVAAAISATDTTNWNSDANPTNELQTISISNDTIYLSNGGFVRLPNISGGKTYIEIFGDVTNAEADSILTADLGPNTQFVYITNTTQLTTVDLTGVNSLMELKIVDNQALTSVNAATLTRCSQLFEIDNNASLTSISLNNVNYFGRIIIEDNNALSGLNLPSLVKSGSISFSNNVVLASLSAPILAKTNELYLSSNGLTSVNLSALNTINGTLNISGNNLLTSLNLSSVTSIISNNMYAVTIGENNALSNLNLNGLTNLASYININNNSSLATASFNGLANAADIVFQGNGLTSLSFPALTTLTVGFTVVGNSSLGTISAPSLTSCAYVNFTQNGVTSINLGALATLNGNLNLIGNANLTSCSLGSLASAQIINITSNGLTSLNLPALQTLSGNGNNYSMTISDNSALATLTVGSLTTTTAIGISNNGLTSISFPALQTLTGYYALDILGNTSLTSLNISSLSSVSEGINISGNTSSFTMQANSLATAKFISIENNGITAFNLPALQTLTGAIPFGTGSGTRSVVISNNPNLTSISANALTSLSEGLSVETNPALSSLSFTSLNSVGGSINFQDNGPMGSVSFPALTSAQYLSISNNGMTSLSFPVLTAFPNHNISYNTSLATLNISAITSFNYGLYLTGNALSNILWPSTISSNSTVSISLSQNSLPSSEINEILALIVASGGSVGACVFLNNQNPAAPPTGQGLVDLDTILNWGGCVTTD
jgi:hypothetical protein